MPSVNKLKKKTKEDAKKVAKRAEKVGEKVAGETKKVASDAKKAGEKVAEETKKAAEKVKKKIWEANYFILVSIFFFFLEIEADRLFTSISVLISFLQDSDRPITDSCVQ